MSHGNSSREQRFLSGKKMEDNTIKTTQFDLLTIQELEEWARLREARNGSSNEVSWKDIVAEADFIQRMATKYMFGFVRVRDLHELDAYIRTRRRSDKVGAILENNPKK